MASGIISPTVARFGILASITIGIGLIALYAMAISGGMESDTTPEVIHPSSADGDDLLQQSGGGALSDLSFDEFMQRVKEQESFTQNHIAGSHEEPAVLIQKGTQKTPKKTSAKAAKKTPPPTTKAKAVVTKARAALSNDATVLKKMAAAAKGEVKTSKEWRADVKPLDDRALAVAKQMLRSAKKEKRQAELRKKERKDQAIVDETKILSRNLDKLPDPPKSAVPNAANSQVAQKVGVPKEYTKPLTRAVNKKAQIEKDEQNGKISKGQAHKLKKKANAEINVAKEAVNRHIAHAAAKSTQRLSVNSEEMPPVPDSEGHCDTVHRLAVSSCELEFWKAKDACTSETLAQKKHSKLQRAKRQNSRL